MRELPLTGNLHGKRELQKLAGEQHASADLNVRNRGIAAVASVKLNGSKGSIAPSSDRCVLCDMDGVERAALGAVNGLGPQFDQVSVIRLVWTCRDENGRLRPRQATDYTF